jgi:putative membrane protein insertion efficiency factor
MAPKEFLKRFHTHIEEVLIWHSTGGCNIGKIIIFIVRKYQSIPHPKMCKFNPSCSEYMVLAVEKYGSVKGFFKGVGRIIRCNPFSVGGEDYP